MPHIVVLFHHLFPGWSTLRIMDALQHAPHFIVDWALRISWPHQLCVEM